MEEAPKLLATAKALGLAVVGVSFHVGSACKNLATFSGAIESARMVRAGRAHQRCGACATAGLGCASSDGKQDMALSICTS